MTLQVSDRAPDVGDVAPDFTLDSTSGAPVRLSDARGGTHVLLAFFPLAFTSTCTAELCDFSTDFDQFASREVRVLPVSVDSVPTLKEFKAKCQIRAELLSDFRREVARAYGVLLEERFFANRAYFLIGKDGTVRWRHIESSPGQKRSNGELLAEIAKLE